MDCFNASLKLDPRDRFASWLLFLISH
jgi:hypothetical protein